ncbi:hypothetical protein SK128_008304 [Halocaridina rubra]|uniref:Uncharacterized protein n=1 Tax=Halocaridina rubra TaxID=373956 RepID=A0AAN9AF04_HALRR
MVAELFTISVCDASCKKKWKENAQVVLSVAQVVPSISQVVLSFAQVVLSIAEVVLIIHVNMHRL